MFCAIVAGEIPATVVHETDTTLAFRDINPHAPTHVLVVPKNHVRDAGELAEAGLADDVIKTAKAVAVAEGIADSGYRLILNTGPDSGQSVFHAHLHLLGGAPLTLQMG
ncbi:histidine triad nucleotide-binding protein [Herbidospora mongoliensis]|uniref:histidine triad nucleotide-binding protein n=1 Tax=Herbidospora mongoliensis TaxID=688067 RepID=UPI000AC3ED19|nr:histidine triad nucleotide-binding protein [Herbidospora mongoliensis]